MMHSYGGVPGSKSSKGLLKKDRLVEEAGRYRGIVSWCAFASKVVICVGIPWWWELPWLSFEVSFELTNISNRQVSSG